VINISRCGFLFWVENERLDEMRFRVFDLEFREREIVWGALVRGSV
jgi:hypothetical protein